jgi:hypothetical protein
MRLVMRASLAAFAVCFGWAVSTFFLSKPVLPTAAWLPLFVGIFPFLFFIVSGGRGIRSWRPRRISLSLSQLRARLPLVVIVVGVTLFFACWVLTMTALWTLRDGGPDIVNGSFYAYNHGSLTPVSEGRYHQLQLAEQRVFTAVPAGFYVAGAVYLLWLLRRPRACA